jgi:hypothetical protein
MKSSLSIFFTSTLITLASSAPTPLATVQLRLIGPNVHYSTSEQTPSSHTGGHIMTLAVGQSLSLDHAPLSLQGLEVVSVSSAQKVVCKASLDFSSKGVTAKSGEGEVILDEGKVVMVTGLSCVGDE